MAVSKKDELRVKLGNKRVERIREQALVPWKRKTPVGSTVYDPGQDKPVPVYPDKAVIHAVAGMRTSESKLTIRRNGDNFSDYADDVPVVAKPVASPFVTSRGERGLSQSPFKRDKKVTVIVRV